MPIEIPSKFDCCQTVYHDFQIPKFRAIDLRLITKNALTYTLTQKAEKFAMTVRFLSVFVGVVLLAGAAVAASNKDGVEALKRGDHATALQIFTELANEGNKFSQFNLGRMYDEGDGVAQDYEEAAKWYRRAAEQGSAMADYNLLLLEEKLASSNAPRVLSDDAKPRDTKSSDSLDDDPSCIRHDTWILVAAVDEDDSYFDLRNEFLGKPAKAARSETQIGGCLGLEDSDGDGWHQGGIEFTQIIMDGSHPVGTKLFFNRVKVEVLNK